MGSTAEVKNSFSFARGFITEASALTFPEDASLDEENYVIRRDGSRRKRHGMDFEEGYVSITGPTKSSYDISTVDTFLWESAGDKSGYNILVVQIGNMLEFFDASDTTAAISANKFVEVVDLNDVDSSGTDILAPGVANMRNFSVSMAAGKGVLYVNSEGIEPLYITVDPDTEDLTTTVYPMLIRDFDGIEEPGLDTDTRPLPLSTLTQMMV